MKKLLLKQSLFAVVAVFAVALAAPIAVNAIPVRAQEAQAAVDEHREASQERKEAAQFNATAKKQAGQAKLADAKLKACQNREKSVTNKMARISDRGTKQLAVFTKISERTQAFYEDKGKVISNYDELVSEVTAKKVAAESAVDAIKNTSVEFKCDGTDPKGTASLFKENLKAEITALKDYKTAVKNLIVGVKSAQGSESSEGSQQ